MKTYLSLYVLREDAMATRKQNYGLKDIVNRDRFGNQSIQTIAGYYLDVQSADGGRKPHPLVDTLMTVRRLENNTNTYYGIPNTLSAGKSGSVGFVFSSWIPDYVRRPAATAGMEASQINNALAKFGSGSIDLGQAIGEGGQTVSMVTSAALRLAQAASQIKRGQFAAAFSTLSTEPSRRGNALVKSLQAASPTNRLAHGWLAYQYGWKPIVSDVYGGIDAYHQKLMDGQVISRAVGKPIEGRGGSLGFNKSLSPDFLGKRNINLSAIPPRVRITGTVRDKRRRTLQELGLQNPGSLAWNLLPYSFVADWFLGIGDYLAGSTALLGMENVRACVVSDNFEAAYVNGILMSKETWIVRKPISATPVFPGVSIAGGLSAQRLLSAVSLLQQRFGR